MDTRQEKPLVTIRLHWGIFIPAFMLLFALSLPLIPIMAVVKIMSSMTQQLSQQPAHSNSWLLFLVLIPDLLIFGVVMLVTWFAYMKSEIKLTSKRLIFSTGILSRMSGELPLENVESIFIIEPFIGRLCGFGTVTITTIGGKTFPLRCIAAPEFFHSKLQNAVANAKAANIPICTPAKRPQDDSSRFMPKS